MARVVVAEQCLIDPEEEKAKAVALLASKKAVSLWKKLSTAVPLVAAKRKARQPLQPPAKRRKRAVSEAIVQACPIVSAQVHYRFTDSAVSLSIVLTVQSAMCCARAFLSSLLSLS